MLAARTVEIRLLLELPDGADSPEEFRVYGVRLHCPRSKRRRFNAVHVDRRLRVGFCFADGNANAVRIWDFRGGDAWIRLMATTSPTSRKLASQSHGETCRILVF